MKNKCKKFVVLQKGLRFGKVEEHQVSIPISEKRADNFIRNSKKYFPKMKFRKKRAC